MENHDILWIIVFADCLKTFFHENHHGISKYQDILDIQDISWNIKIYLGYARYIMENHYVFYTVFTWPHKCHKCSFFEHFDRLYRENLADRIEQCLFFVIFVSRIYVIKCQKCPNVAFYRFCVVRRRRLVVGTILFFTFFPPLGNPASPGLMSLNNVLLIWVFSIGSRLAVRVRVL